MPKGIPLTEEEQQRRRKEIFDATVHLFIEKGFKETSMRQIAKTAGVGKSTLYDYFKSKDEILVSYFEDAIYELTERVKEIVALKIPISDKIKKIMEMHLFYLIDSKTFYLKLSADIQSLSLRNQKKIQEQRYTYQDMLSDLIQQGIQQGVYKPVNPLFAARGIFMLLTMAVFTSRPETLGDPEEMMEDALSIFFEGILA